MNNLQSLNLQKTHNISAPASASIFRWKGNWVNLPWWAEYGGIGSVLKCCGFYSLRWW